MKDELDLLLIESLKYEMKKKKGTGVKIRIEKIKETIHSAYANPDNWEFRRVVDIDHIATNGLHTYLGTFREYVYKRGNSRKLCRDQTLQGTAVETVTGDYWIHIDIPEPSMPSIEDQIAIRNYLNQQKDIPLKPLLKELNAEALLIELRGF